MDKLDSLALQAKNKYEVETHEFGVAIYGTLPLSDSVSLMKSYTDKGFEILDTHIAEKLGAVLVITTKEGGQEWRKQLGLKPQNVDWINSGDTGLSSKTIYSVLGGKSVLSRHEYSAPFDPDDFGRCYRLMRRHPEWKDRLLEVATECEDWFPIVEHWDELVRLFEKEGQLDELGHPTVETMPSLYARMLDLGGITVTTVKSRYEEVK